MQWFFILDPILKRAQDKLTKTQNLKGIKGMSFLTFLASMPHITEYTASSFQLILAVSIFLFSFILILSEKFSRAIIAFLGGGLLVITGVLTDEDVIHALDFETLGLLLGMMIIVAIMKDSGIFQYAAIKAAKLSKAKPAGILIAFFLITAIFSALLDNVTTVLLITPVILLVVEELEVKPYPYLFSTILASNIGGATTLIGDPPNIMIGSAAHLSFNDFIVNLFPVTLFSGAITLAVILWVWRKDLHASERAKQRIMRLNEKASIINKKLAIQSLLVMFFVLLGFVLGHHIGISPATIAMFGAAVMLLLDNLGFSAHEQNERFHLKIGEAEWVTLFFFGGLFILVYGLEKTGIIQKFAYIMLDFTGGDYKILGLSILWSSAIISALIDNIPFVATMIPLIQDIGMNLGEGADITSLWWALSLGACLGGNGSLVGASANLVVAGIAERGGYSLKFIPFMLRAFPLMILSIFISSFYLSLFYL